ncbi:MAG: site-specific DNA-methyltransferase [Betaproteobacteria bacterium]|nr:site-specific DNA-methyltransferase [Betaproteobacteria bacterium]
MNLDTCHLGDCREIMRRMIGKGLRVQTIVTSPPYWGLRDYGVSGQLGLEPLHDCLGWATGEHCGECHVCKMAEAFRLAHELLADDGTLWLNYGDCYAGGGIGGGLKPKDLAMMPARIALALQADGWYLRSDIIWAKTAAMPESIKDRPTKSHEHVFLFSKSERYFYNHLEAREPSVWDSESNGVGFGHGTDKHARDRGRVKIPAGWETGPGQHGKFHADGRGVPKNYSFARKVQESPPPGSPVQHRPGREDVRYAETRNWRDVWTLGPEPFKGAHFATFPRALAERCIVAGSRPGDVVFDPFMGSGTVGEVAESLGRRWLGCELNPDYLALQKKRIRQRGLVLEMAVAASSLGS